MGAIPAGPTLIRALDRYQRELPLNMEETRAFRQLIDWVLEDLNARRKQALIRFRHYD